VDVAFWSELGDLKLNTWRLSEEKVNLQGKSPSALSLNTTALASSMQICCAGTCSSTLGAGMPAFVQLERSSFTKSATATAQVARLLALESSCFV